MLPAILGLGGLTAKIIATAVIPRVVRALSSSFSPTRPAEPCPPTPVEGISSGPEPAPAPVLSGVSATRFSSRKWGYAGLWHHGPSGLDLATYRLYDAANRRWISRDPLGEGVDYNLYRYCGNNPVSLNDPEGLVPIVYPPGRYPGGSDGPSNQDPGQTPLGGSPGLPGLLPLLGVPAAGVSLLSTGPAAVGAGLMGLQQLLNHGIPGRFNGPDSRENHHLFPQNQRDWFNQRGFDVDKFPRWLPRGLHRLKKYDGIHTKGCNRTLNMWHSEWKLFQINNPDATKEDIIHFLIDMRQRYGI